MVHAGEDDGSTVMQFSNCNKHLAQRWTSMIRFSTKLAGNVVQADDVVLGM